MNPATNAESNLWPVFNSSSSPVLVNDMTIYLCHHVRLCMSGIALVFQSTFLRLWLRSWPYFKSSAAAFQTRLRQSAVKPQRACGECRYGTIGKVISPKSKGCLCLQQCAVWHLHQHKNGAVALTCGSSFYIVRLAAHVSNGLKSRIRPVVGRI